MALARRRQRHGSWRGVVAAACEQGTTCGAAESKAATRLQSVFSGMRVRQGVNALRQRHTKQTATLETEQAHKAQAAMRLQSSFKGARGRDKCARQRDARAAQRRPYLTAAC